MFAFQAMTWKLNKKFGFCATLDAKIFKRHFSVRDNCLKYKLKKSLDFIWFFISGVSFMYLHCNCYKDPARKKTILNKHLLFYFQKTLTIFNSAFYGGAVMATGFDFFVENSKMLLWVWDRVRVRESEPLCWFSWAILATWPLTLLLGKQNQGIYYHFH